jgi:glutamate racemase
MERAIGVFDSGVGGLSVLREIRSALPAENLFYVADSAAAPYGERPRQFIEERSRSIVEFFVGEGVKAVVVACNTATAVAVGSLRSKFDLPIVAIEPAVKPASGLTRSKVVGVLGTSQALAGENVSDLAERFGRDVKILLQACPGLVERVEAGDLDSPATRALVERFVRPLVDQGADTLVLGCTHYPFLRASIAEAAGPGVTVLDPAAAVARQLHRRLDAAGLLSRSTIPGGERFWTSGTPARVKPVVAQLWGAGVGMESLPASFAVVRG